MEQILTKPIRLVPLSTVFIYIGIHRFIWFINCENNISIPIYMLCINNNAESQDPSFGNDGGIRLLVQ